MSLLKQLLLSVTVAILAISVGTMAFSIQAARQYLDGQLQTESENTATSLALTLSQPANQDPIAQELLMMALFDSGQFRRIRLAAPDGNVLFERTQQAKSSSGQTPAWFGKLLPLSQPKAQRAVSDGWRQVGQLTIEVDNSYALDALWRSSTRLLFFVLIAGAFWAVFVALLLNWFRRVLREEIAAQVLAIGNQTSADGSLSDTQGGEATTPAPLRVAELSSVVSAIADARQRVRATAQEQSERIESLQLEVNLDPVTRLPNRKYFVNELRRALGGDAGQSATHGHVLLFRQRDLLALNTHMTRASADAWLTTVGECVNEVLTQAVHGQRAQLARLNGSDFVVLIPALEGPQAMHLVQQVRQVLQSLRVTLDNGQWCRWAYALTDYMPPNTVSDVLSRLDQALMRTESAGHAEVEYVAGGDGSAANNTVGEGQWRQILAEALATSDQLSLAVHTQLCEDAHHQQARAEASLTLHDAQGQPISGALFLPVAVRLGLSADFDLRATALGLQWLEENPEQLLVIRVSLPSLAQAAFVAQLRELLQNTQASTEVRSHLLLELDAHGLIAYPDEVSEFCAVVTQAGAGVGLRRLDQQPMALTHLHTLPLYYVKLGGDMAEQSQTSPGIRHLLQAMIDTAQALGVRVYMGDVTDTAMAQRLREQGCYLPMAHDTLKNS